MEHQNNWDEAGLNGVGGIQKRGGNNAGAAMNAVGSGAIARTAGALTGGTGAIARTAGAGAAVMDVVGTGAIARAAGAVVGGTLATFHAVWTPGTASVAAINAVGTGAGTSSAAEDLVGTSVTAWPTGTITDATLAAGTGGSTLAASGGAAAGTGSQSARTERERNYPHTRHQIQALETFLKDHPRPRENKICELARNLQLEPDQVRFWLENQRNQLKAKRKLCKQKSDALRAQKQQRTEPSGETSTSRGGDAGGSHQPLGRDYILMENVRLREEVKTLKSTLASVLAQFCTPSTTPVQNLHMIPQIPQNLPKEPVTNKDVPTIFQNLEKRPVISQNPQNHPILSEVASNTGPCPSHPGPGVADTSITTSRGVLDSTTNEPTPARFRQSFIKSLVVSAAEEIKVLSFTGEPLWTPSSADGATSELVEVEYLAQIPNLFEPTRLAYRREASRHVGRVLLSPRQLLDILMNVGKWSFMFSPIVLRASTLEVLSEGVDYDGALHVMAAEYHLATPLVPNRKTYFARYCTKHEEGVWVVVDVSLDQILQTQETMNCQKGPSGCLIQELSDGTSKITWIEHVFVDYSGVSTMYHPILLSGFGLGAKRWVATLERQWQRLATEISADISATQEFNNLLMSRPQGRRSLLKLADKMVNNFISGIAGLNTGRWTQVHGNFGGGVRLMSTRVTDHPGLPNATVLSVSTSFVVPFAPKRVFDSLRDHKFRKETNIFANANDYEPVCCISSGEDTKNCVSVHKVPMTTSPVHILLQESWSDSVASHIVFASTEIGNIDVILGGSSGSSLPILPSGFTILPHGSSLFTEGSSGTLLTVSFQVLTKEINPVDAGNCEDVSKSLGYLRCSCQNIKHAFGVVDANTSI